MTDSFFKWLKHTVRVVLVYFPFVVAYGFVFPWPAGEHAIGRYAGQTQIMVAASSSSRSSWDARSRAWVTREKAQTRSYVLLPSVFAHPAIVTVSQTNDDEPTVSESSGPLIAVALVGLVALALFGFRYFATRSPPQDQLSPADAESIYGSQLPRREFGRRAG
jgi:hypothetical protein